MIRPIYRERADKNKWNRFFVNAKNDLGSINFLSPDTNKETDLVPVTENLYLLDYLLFNIPEGIDKITFQNVLDAIPEEIKEDVYAVEVFYIFNQSDSWLISLFDEDKRNSSILWVALLTEKNTGKNLPPVKMTKENAPKTKPIGITDEEWYRIQREFRLI